MSGKLPASELTRQPIGTLEKPVALGGNIVRGPGRRLARRQRMEQERLDRYGRFGRR